MVVRFDASRPGHALEFVPTADAPTSERGSVFSFESSPVGAPHLSPSESPEFDALLAEMEANPEEAALLAQSRHKLAREFYPDAPTLAALRLAAGLSQQQLAQACGWSQPTIARYESGRHQPTLDNARVLTAALGVDMNTLDQAFRNTRPVPVVLPTGGGAADED